MREKPHLYVVAAILVCCIDPVISQTMLGGFKDQEDFSNDAAVQSAAVFAVSEISKDLKLEQILSAQKQVVAGTNYKLTLKTSAGSYEALVYKGLGENAQQELTSYKKLDGVDCPNSGQFGGAKALSVQDSEVQQAAEAVVQQLSSRSNSLFPMKLKEVLSAHSKVHGAGTEFRLQLRVSQGDLPDTTLEADITRGLMAAQYQLGTVTRLGHPSQ